MYTKCLIVVSPQCVYVEFELKVLTKSHTLTGHIIRYT